MNFGLPKEEKLKSTIILDLLFKKGVVIKVFPIRLIYLKTNVQNGRQLIKVGVSVPKRHYKKAVHRNRIKRLMRESYRQNKPKVTGNYTLFFIYQNKGALPSFQKISKTIELLIQKFEEQCGT